jgi:hypothetical protein
MKKQILNEEFIRMQKLAGIITESQYEDLTYEPEDMDNPDEDLVIIGSGYLDIKNKFRERPSQTNSEYAEIGQKVVDQLHNGDKEAALDFIYSKINESNTNESQLDEGKLLKEVRGPLEVELSIKKGEAFDIDELMDDYGFDYNVDEVPVEDLFDENGFALKDMVIVYDQRDDMYLMDAEDMEKYH